MRRSGRLVVFLLAVCVAAGARAVGAAGEEPDTKPADPNVDVSDLWQRMRHKPDAGSATLDAAPSRFFVVAPSIGSKPSTGVTAGLSGNLAFFASDPAETRISSLIGGIKISQKGQMSAGAKLSAFTPGDRWFISADSRISLTSLNTYPLGADAATSDGENLKYDFVRAYGAAYRKMRPGLFMGGGINVSRHSDVRPAIAASAQSSGYAAYTADHGFSPAVQTSSGTSIGLVLDTRDNSINAQRGYSAATTYRTFFRGFLGGSSAWQELSIDARTYRRLTADGRQRLALWALTDLVVGGVAPYLDLPATGGDNYGRLARGYGEGRYRGEHLVSERSSTGTP